LLAQLRGGRSVLLRETRKKVQGADFTCPHCVEEEEDLEHVLKACPELEKKLCAGPPPLLIMSMDQAEMARYFREVFNWGLP
jgi:hypothetical protein